MDIFDQILENLELERDLGVRTVEMDRALLKPPEAVRTAVPAREPPTRPSAPVAVRSPAVGARVTGPPVRAVQEHVSPASPEPSTAGCDIAFFTGRPLSPSGSEAMEKIFAAIRKIRPDAVLCINAERRAKVCVLLGSDALLKRNPAARPVRGAWTSVGGVPAVMTFSPDYIFSHFQEGSPRMKDAKLVMWNDIKSAVARLA